MSINNPYDKYRLNAINTATPAELTLMLYNGALKFCNQAMVAFEQDDYIKANKLIQRVEDIIREFQITLNRKYQISEQFDMMYDYIYRCLVNANIKKSVELLEEATGLIRTMRDTWKEAMKLAKQD